MDCEKYKNLYPKFSKLPLPVEIWDTPEYQDFVEHTDGCLSCDEWTLAQTVRQRGARVEDHPCVHIAYRVTAKYDSPLDDPFDDPDVIIWQFETSGEYGLPVRDGGSSMIVIQNCPWCGIALHNEQKK